jgi:tetratricopeptide (TPR) repeat protein
MKYFILIIIAFIISLNGFCNKNPINEIVNSNKLADTTKIRNLIKIGEQVIDYNSDSARIIWKIADKICSKQLKKNPSDTILLSFKSVITNNLGVAFYYEGVYDSVLYYWQISLDTDLKLGNEESTTSFYNNIAQVYINKGDMLNAIKSYQKAIGIANKYNKIKENATYHSNLAYCFDLTGDLEKALEMYKISLSIAEKITNEEDANYIIAGVFSGFGRIYQIQKDFKTALDYFYKSKTLYNKLNQKKKETESLNNIGSVYTSIGDLDKALEIYNEANLQFIELNFKKGISMTYNNIANIYIKQKKFDKAIIFLRKSIVLNTEIAYQSGLFANYENLGDVYTELHKYDSSKFYYEKGYEIAKNLGNPESIKTISLVMSKLYETNNDLYNALRFYKIHKIASDSIINDETKNLTNKMLHQLEFEKQKILIEKEQEKKDLIIKEENTRKNILILSIIVILIVVLMFSFFLYNRFKITNNQKKIIEVQKKEVEQKNKDITDSIQYAQKIQSAILPNEEIFRKTIPDSFILFKPKDIVSGDFYWLSDREDYVFYATADSTGHGVPGGFMSMLGTALLNEIIDERKLKDCGEVLTLMREKIMQALKQTGDSESKDGMDMVLIRIDKKTLKMEYAAANNSFYVIASETKQSVNSEGLLHSVRNDGLVELPCDKMPVGVYHSEVKPFQTFKHQLNKGDIIYTYTDGYADQFGGEKGKKYTYKRLREKLVAISGKPLAEQKMSLENEFESWKGDNEQIDDVCLIGVKV